MARYKTVAVNPSRSVIARVIDELQYGISKGTMATWNQSTVSLTPGDMALVTMAVLTCCR